MRLEEQASPWSLARKNGSHVSRTQQERRATNAHQRTARRAAATSYPKRHTSKSEIQQEVCQSSRQKKRAEKHGAKRSALI